MSEASASPKRPRLEFDEASKDDHHDKYSKNRDHDDQGSFSNCRKRRGDTDEDDMKECEDLKSKTVGMDAGRREHTLVMRLTGKEQELQECMNQIQEMKQAQTQNMAQLRSMLLDPAINLVFQRMSKEMEEHKEKLKQKQNELNAWKFTADSQTGMRLMGKCRMLLQENGELGKIISSGRTAKLEGEISLHKALVAEMKKNQKELDEFVGDLEEDVEGMQGMIFMLQQQLKEAREQISRLQQENEQLRTLQLPSEPDPGGLMGKNGPSGSGGESNGLSGSSPSHLASPPCLLSTDSLQPRVSITSFTTPPSTSSDSVPVISSGELSPGTVASLKVTPDSGVHTQEEEDDAYTDSPSVNDFASSNLSDTNCHNAQSHLNPNPKPCSSAKSPFSHLEDGYRTCTASALSRESRQLEGEDGEEDSRTLPETMTSGSVGGDGNGSVSPPCVSSGSVGDGGMDEERTSQALQTGTVVNSNGDILVTTNKEDSQSSEGDGEDCRTHSSHDVKVFCKDRTEEREGEVVGGVKVMLNSSDKVSGVETVTSCIAATTVLTNGSSEEVTSSSGSLATE